MGRSQWPPHRAARRPDTTASSSKPAGYGPPSYSPPDRPVRGRPPARPHPPSRQHLAWRRGPLVPTPSGDLPAAGRGGGQRAAGRGEPGAVDQATPRPPPHLPGRVCRLQPGRRPPQRHPLVRHPEAGRPRADLGRGHRRPPPPAARSAAGTCHGRGADRRAPTGHRGCCAGQLLPAHPHRRPRSPGPGVRHLRTADRSADRPAGRHAGGDGLGAGSRDQPAEPTARAAESSTGPAHPNRRADRKQPANATNRPN